MKTHSPRELRYTASLIDADGSTILGTARAGLTDLAGTRIKETQLQTAESTHVIVMRAPDARALSVSGFVQIDGALYVVDYTSDAYNAQPARAPQPGMWLEVFCHAQRGGA